MRDMAKDVTEAIERGEPFRGDRDEPEKKARLHALLEELVGLKSRAVFAPIALMMGSDPTELVHETPFPLALALGVVALTGCAQGNLRTPGSYAAPAPPPVRNPWYDPYAAYGSSNATWRSPVYDLQRTIVKPVEPASQASRPDYEGAEWATGAGGGSTLRPMARSDASALSGAAWPIRKGGASSAPPFPFGSALLRRRQQEGIALKVR